MKYLPNTENDIFAIWSSEIQIFDALKKNTKDVKYFSTKMSMGTIECHE